jgi:replicative DNA helicase
MVNLEELKLPPHNIEAEKGVIAAVLLDNDNMYIFDGLALTDKDFYLKEHQYIYKAILELRNDKKTIDVITLSDRLKKD